MRWRLWSSRVRNRPNRVEGNGRDDKRQGQAYAAKGKAQAIEEQER